MGFMHAILQEDEEMCMDMQRQQQQVGVDPLGVCGLALICGA
jgi:hypothetical protein